VDHAHFHIIPRFHSDGFKHWPQGKYQGNEAQQIADEIKRFL
ncbi:HIT family protein, partial [Candidatus Woesearchaeota archaeon]|nr:HIT family protein [Candidatus Woesearchaeota archaeon]